MDFHWVQLVLLNVGKKLELYNFGLDLISVDSSVGIPLVNLINFSKLKYEVS